MRFRGWLHDYWLTLFLLLSITLGSVWLAAQGKLSLYVHPRYILFTVIMSALAVCLVAADAITRKKMPALRQSASWSHVGLGVVCIAICAGLLILKPAGLSSVAADQRGINTAAIDLSSSSSLTDLTAANTAFERFTVKEWASLLAQTSDPKLFTGKPANVTGFVSPAPGNNPNVFYVARFVLTCCAVDARPIGVPVYQPDWRQTYRADQWLNVQGSFTPNPDGGGIPIVLSPKNITPTSEPEEPYVY